MKNRNKKFFLVTAVIIMLFTLAFSSNAALVGDVTGENDGITAADARIILRASVGLETLTDEVYLLADTDENGNITAADARIVLRMSVGLEEQLHYYTKEILSAPDCVTAGKGKATCTECTDAYEYDIPALGHDFGEAEILVQVTCETDGLEKYTCKREACGFIEERTVPLGHTPDIPAATCTKDQFCTRGSHIIKEKLGHTTDWGVCSNCKVYITDRHSAAAATIKTKYLEAVAASDKAYAYINETIGSASWLQVKTKSAKIEYTKSKAAFEAAYNACGDIPEFASIKENLGKAIENTQKILTAADVILSEKYVDSSNYPDLVTGIDIPQWANDNINNKLKKAIIW